MQFTINDANFKKAIKALGSVALKGSKARVVMRDNMFRLSVAGCGVTGEYVTDLETGSLDFEAVYNGRKLVEMLSICDTGVFSVPDGRLSFGDMTISTPHGPEVVREVHPAGAVFDYGEFDVSSEFMITGKALNVMASNVKRFGERYHGYGAFDRVHISFNEECVEFAAKDSHRYGMIRAYVKPSRCDVASVDAGRLAAVARVLSSYDVTVKRDRDSLRIACSGVKGLSFALPSYNDAVPHPADAYEFGQYAVVSAKSLADMVKGMDPNAEWSVVGFDSCRGIGVWDSCGNKASASVSDGPDGWSVLPVRVSSLLDAVKAAVTVGGKGNVLVKVGDDSQGVPSVLSVASGGVVHGVAMECETITCGVFGMDIPTESSVVFPAGPQSSDPEPSAEPEPIEVEPGPVAEHVASTVEPDIVAAMTRFEDHRPVDDSDSYRCSCGAIFFRHDALIEHIVSEIAFPAVGFESDGLRGFLAPATDGNTEPASWTDPKPVAETVEPEPETAEIPEVPPQANTDARVVHVSSNVIPLGVAAREFEPFKPFNRRPRAFRDAAGRKRVYVCFTDTECVVAVRDGYTWGMDPALEREVGEYLSRYGWTLAA